MPKNKKGGSRHKKMARKHQNPITTTRKLRYAKEQGEMYAKVTELYGGGHARVLCSDGNSRLLCIPRRFKGRNRWDNNVTRDAVLLVGARQYEVLADKSKEKVDLLYVYGKSEIDELKNSANVDSFIFPEDKDMKGFEEAGFEFTDDKDWNDIYEEENSKKSSETKNTTLADELDDEIDFDDI